MANNTHSALTGAELHVPGYVQASDPGAVGAGKLWIDTALGTGKWALKLRNAANSGWEQDGSADLNGGTIDATVIGGTSPAAGSFTALAASTGLTVAAGTGGANPTLAVAKDWATGGPTNILATFDSYGDGTRFLFRGANGSSASPTQTLSGNGLGQIGWRGYQSTTGAFSTVSNAIISVAAAQDFTSTAQGTTMTFYTTPIGSTTATLALTIGSDKKLTVAGDLAHTGTNAGFYGVTPAARPSAYTQTYATATKTHANPTSATLTAAFGTSDGTVADVGAAFNQTTLNNNFQDLATAINALRVDLINLKGVVNSVIDDGQITGLLQ